MKAIRIVFKGIGVVFLLWLGLLLWFTLSPLFLPGPSAGPGTWESVQPSLEGLAEVRQAGPEADAEYRRQIDLSRPFDNSLVIYYAVPAMLVWWLCAAARARKVSPMAIVGALTLLWFAFAVFLQVISWTSFNYASVVHRVMAARYYLYDKEFWLLAAIAIAALVIAALCVGGIIFSVVFYSRYVPRRIDSALVELLDEEEGWLARNYGPNIARKGHWLVVVVLTGIVNWTVWRMCDGIDGGGIPDTLGLAGRLAVVAHGAYLLIRTHLGIASYRPKLPGEGDPSPHRPPSAHGA